MTGQTTTLGALLQDYEAQELTLLEPGEYECEIVHCKPRQTDVMPTFKVLSGPYAGKRAMFGTISFNGNAAPRFFGTMRQLGLEKAWFEQFGPGLGGPELCKHVATALTGRKGVFEVNQEPYKTEMRNKLVKVVRLTEIPAQAATGGVPVVPVAPAAPVAPAIPVAAGVPAPAPAAPVAPVAPVAEVPAAPAAVVPLPVAAVPEVPGVPAIPVPGVPVVEVPAAAAVAASAIPAPVPGVPMAAAPVAVAAAPVAAAPAATIPVDDEPGF